MDFELWMLFCVIVLGSTAKIPRNEQQNTIHSTVATTKSYPSVRPSFPSTTETSTTEIEDDQMKDYEDNFEKFTFHTPEYEDQETDDQEFEDQETGEHDIKDQNVDDEEIDEELEEEIEKEDEEEEAEAEEEKEVHQSAAFGNNSTENRSEDPGTPTFTHPDNMSRLVAKPSGNMVRIRCAATGSPEPKITWTKNGDKINRRVGQVHYRKWAIILEDLVPTDSGNYTCNVCNIHKCINYTTRLAVKDRFPARPYILEGSPANITTRVNETARFNCPTITDIAAHITWAKYRASNDSNDSPPEALKLETDPENPEELRLENVTHSHEGWYTCIAANSLGMSSASAYLRVVDELTVDKPILAENKIHSHYFTILATLLGLFFLVAMFVVFYTFKKLKHEKLQKHRAMETVHQWTKKVIIVKPSDDEVDGPEAMQIPIVRIEKQRTTMFRQQATNDANMFNEYEFPLDSNWEFPRNKLTLGPTLGEGAFGRVVMAEAHGLINHSSNMIVAVKMVKEGHTDSDMTSLVREMEVMKMIGKHINIINLLGCCSQDGPLYVIVEYAPHGNLKDFLKKNLAMAEYSSLSTQHVLTQKDLTSFAFQVARGMEYLASRRCIHRDLAARNVLVCDDYIVKIADFGLARDLQESDYYRKSTNGRLPIKWMAPESLRDKFYDSQSDVWSYGILIWEIMTFGEQPYPHIYSSEQLYDYLEKGYRMEKPQRCPINIYMLTRQCWNWKPNTRPTFTEIVDTLAKILSSTENEEYLELENVPFLDETYSMHSDDEDNNIAPYHPFLDRTRC